MTPGDFWKLHPTVLWWWFETKMGVRMVGSMRQEQADELIAFMQEQGI